MPKPTTPDDDNATGNAGEAPAWLSVSAAALALGVSARAIQKRAERGTLTARRVAHGRAHRWEIDAREIGGDAFANGSQDVRKMGAKRSQDVRDIAAPERETVREPFAKGSQDGRGVVADLRAQLERERGEVAFLRGIVESDRRDMAEVRAALRAALKLAGAASVPMLEAGTPETPDATTTGKPANDSPTTATASNSGSGARERPLTVGDIADEIENRLRGT
jgi:hypothetical protein